MTHNVTQVPLESPTERVSEREKNEGRVTDDVTKDAVFVFDRKKESDTRIGEKEKRE